MADDVYKSIKEIPAVQVNEFEDFEKALSTASLENPKTTLIDFVKGYTKDEPTAFVNNYLTKSGLGKEKINQDSPIIDLSQIYLRKEKAPDQKEEAAINEQLSAANNRKKQIEDYAAQLSAETDFNKKFALLQSIPLDIVSEVLAKIKK